MADVASGGFPRCLRSRTAAARTVLNESVTVVAVKERAIAMGPKPSVVYWEKPPADPFTEQEVKTIAKVRPLIIVLGKDASAMLQATIEALQESDQPQWKVKTLHLYSNDKENVVLCATMCPDMTFQEIEVGIMSFGETQKSPPFMATTLPWRPSMLLYLQEMASAGAP